MDIACRSSGARRPLPEALVDLLSVDAMQTGQRLVSTYPRYGADAVNSDGTVSWDGKKFASASAAGCAVWDGKATNGWAFWAIETYKRQETTVEGQLTRLAFSVWVIRSADHGLPPQAVGGTCRQTDLETPNLNSQSEYDCTAKGSDIAWTLHQSRRFAVERTLCSPRRVSPSSSMVASGTHVLSMDGNRSARTPITGR